MQCAVGIVQNPDNKILIAKRPLHKPGGGFWEFPGGKLELNESAEEALARELWEELGIQCDPCSFKPFLSYRFEYPTHGVLLTFFLVDEFSGVPKGLEGQTIQWTTISELREYPMLEGNIRALEMLEIREDTESI